jgi:hypothetical protein
MRQRRGRHSRAKARVVRIGAYAWAIRLRHSHRLPIRLRIKQSPPAFRVNLSRLPVKKNLVLSLSKDSLQRARSAFAGARRSLSRPQKKAGAGISGARF